MAPLRPTCVTRYRGRTASFAGLVGLLVVGGTAYRSAPETPADRSIDRVFRAGQTSADWSFPPHVDPGPMETRVYDVEKALIRIAADESTKDAARFQMYWEFVHTLRASTGQYKSTPIAWAKEKIKLEGATLTATAPVRLHEEFATRLRAWELSGLGQISVGPQLLIDETDIAAAAGISWRSLGVVATDREGRFPAETKIGASVIRAEGSVDQMLPVGVALVNDQQALALIAQASASNASQRSGLHTVVSEVANFLGVSLPRDTSTKVLQLPKPTSFNGAQVSMFHGAQRRFVIGTRSDGNGVLHPKVAFLDEGIKLTWRATQSGDAKKVQLEASVEWSDVGEVGSASAIVGGETATIELPRVYRRCIDVTSEVPDGQSLLIGCFPSGEQKKYFYVLLSVHSFSASSIRDALMSTAP